MPIVFVCSCGKKLKVGDEQAGKRVRCPVCNEVVPVPPSEKPPAPRPPRAAAPPPATRQKVTDRPAHVRKPPDEDEEPPRLAPEHFEDEEERKPRRRSQRPLDEVEELEEVEAPRPARRPKGRRRDHSGETGFLSGRGAASSGMGPILGGLLMMVIAVVWFVAGLMNDIIFFYPPILFVFGIAAFFKGMMGGE